MINATKRISEIIVEHMLTYFPFDIIYIIYIIYNIYNIGYLQEHIERGVCTAQCTYIKVYILICITLQFTKLKGRGRFRMRTIT